MLVRCSRGHNLLPEAIVDLRDLRHGGSVVEPLHPSGIMRPLCGVHVLRHERERALAHSLEVRDEHQIGVCELIADQEVGAVLDEMSVDDADDALDLVRVSLDGGGQLLRVVVREPAELPEVGPLPTDLEVLPTARRALFFRRRVVQLGVFVVFLD